MKINLRFFPLSDSDQQGFINNYLFDTMRQHLYSNPVDAKCCLMLSAAWV